MSALVVVIPIMESRIELNKCFALALFVHLFAPSIFQYIQRWLLFHHFEYRISFCMLLLLFFVAVVQSKLIISDTCEEKKCMLWLRIVGLIGME